MRLAGATVVDVTLLAFVGRILVALGAGVCSADPLYAVGGVNGVQTPIVDALSGR